MSAPTRPTLPDPLQRDDVAGRLPPLGQQIDLVEATYRAMARGETELPPKIGVHPRTDAFLHAMPAYIRGDEVVALKWVSGFPANPSRGLPYISGVIVVNDAETGIPVAIMDAAEITAARTAAASGVCIRAWAPAGWARAAILGCGEQARYHAAVLRHLRPGVEISAYDPLPQRVETLGGDVRRAETAEAAVAGADVVISAGPIVARSPAPLTTAWLGDRPWLLLPIDFDLYVSAQAAASADLFVTDDVGQFEAYRGAGHFTGWPAPSASVGQALEGGREGSHVLACNLGVATLDAAFARAVLGNDPAGGRA
jgi:ornithine cyclodeaminase/alanine dehydrogenase